MVVVFTPLLTEAGVTVLTEAGAPLLIPVPALPITSWTTAGGALAVSAVGGALTVNEVGSSDLEVT